MLTGCNYFSNGWISMDNERRHELQQNELAGQIVKARTWIEPYVVPILAVVIAVTLVGIIYNFIQSQRSSGRSEATMELLFATAMDPVVGEDAEAYDRVAQNFAGTAPADIARIAKADIFLAQGIEALFRDRVEAEGRLADAVDAYQNVLETTSIGILKSRAQFGLAQAYESQGKLSSAIEAYEKVIQSAESEKMTQVAQSRIAMLKRPDTEAFVTWFGSQNPSDFDPAATPGMPSGSGIPGMPDFQFPGVEPVEGDSPLGTGAPSETMGNLLQGPLSSGTGSLPEGGEFTLPVEGQETTPATETPAESPAIVPPAPADPAGNQPAPGNQPVETPPAGEPAVSEEPATEEPATEEPATEEPAAEEPPVTEVPAPASETPAPQPQGDGNGGGDGDGDDAASGPQPPSAAGGDGQSSNR
jgi:hypothetical protein